MKTEYKLFAGVALFFGPIGLIYGFTTHWEEPVGFVALILCFLLGSMIAFYLWFTGNKLPERPEDNPAGEISDQEGDYGFFSPHSWWPVALAGAGALCFLGVAVGWWLFIIGAALGAIALCGWTFEYFKGAHAL